MALPFNVIILLQFVLDITAQVSVYIFLTLSLNIEYGYAGITNLGKVLFMAAGGYSIALITPALYQWILNVNITKQAVQSVAGGEVTNVDFDVIFNHLLAQEVNKRLTHDPLVAISVFLISLAVAMLVGGALGILASFPAVRLRDDYLAISLLAFAEITTVLGTNFKPFNFGTQIPDPFIWAGGGFSRYAAMTLTMLLIALLVFIYSQKIAKSPLCRVLKSMRDNQHVTEALGRNTTRLKMKALCVGSAISTLGGALYGFYSSQVQVNNYSRITFTFWPYLMLIVGGAGNNEGALLGCIVFVVVRRLINFYKNAFTAFLPFDPVWLDYMILGIILLIMLTRRPQGILPERSTPTMPRSGLERIRQLVLSTKNGKSEAEQE